MSTACIVSTFNWLDYGRPRANLRRFQRQMVRAGVPLYGTEAYLKHQTPVTAGWPGWEQIQVTRRHVMFLKESLLNLTEKRVPEHFNKIAWLDADVDFSNPNWLQHTDEALDAHPVVQPFSEAIWTGRDGATVHREIACASLAQPDKYLAGHPGFAWAARRELWTEHGGLYPLAVLGHGDMVNAAAFYGADLKDIQRGFGREPGALWAWEAWREGVLNWTRRNVGCVAGTIYHEWHGDREDRAYAKRLDFLEGMNPDEHLEEDERGILRWSDDAPPELLVRVRSYFESRREDG